MKVKKTEMEKQREQKLWLKLCVLLISLLITVPQAGAHNLWLSLDHYYHDVGNTAKIFLYLAHSLPFADLGRPEKMKEFYYLEPSGKRKSLDLKKPDPESFFNEVGVPLNLKDEGTYLCAVVMKPVFVSVTPEGKKRKSKSELPDALSCRYVEFFAKAVFHAGMPGGNGYKTILGHTIEIMPQKDPGLIKSGEYLPIKVLFKGKPLANEFVYATYIGFSTGEEYAYTTRTDHNGIAGIRILNPGIWWVKVPYKRHHENKSECDIDQYATIMTFEVK